MVVRRARIATISDQGNPEPKVPCPPPHFLVFGQDTRSIPRVFPRCPSTVCRRLRRMLRRSTPLAALKNAGGSLLDASYALFPTPEPRPMRVLATRTAHHGSTSTICGVSRSRALAPWRDPIGRARHARRHGHQPGKRLPLHSSRRGRASHDTILYANSPTHRSFASLSTLRLPLPSSSPRSNASPTTPWSASCPPPSVDRRAACTSLAATSSVRKNRDHAARWPEAERTVMPFTRMMAFINQAVTVRRLRRCVRTAGIRSWTGRPTRSTHHRRRATQPTDRRQSCRRPARGHGNSREIVLQTAAPGPRLTRSCLFYDERHRTFDRLTDERLATR